MEKFILTLSFIFISVFSISQNNKIFKLKAKQITMKTTTTEYGKPAIVDFLVAIDYDIGRIIFYRDKKEIYDIIKINATEKNEGGSITCYTCINEYLKEYEICDYAANTMDKVIFTLKEKNSTVTTMIICAYIND